MVPLDDVRFAFLIGRGEYEVEGRKYSRLRTMKLRGELSQGLVLSLDDFKNDIAEIVGNVTLAEALGVIKYDPPESNHHSNKLKSGQSGGAFPSFIHKTDQERIQNIVRQYSEAALNDEPFEITYKLDGSSTTVYVNENTFGVCSRNINLKIPDNWNEADSHFIQAAVKAGWLFKLILIKLATGRNLAFQGELCGPGIQNNFESLDQHELFLYDIFDIDTQRYLLPMDRIELAIKYDIDHVPFFESLAVLPLDINECLLLADGESGLNGKYREGLVFKSHIRDFSFKAISTKYLLEEK